MTDAYKQNFEIAALQGFEKVSDVGFQTSANEDAPTEVIEQNGSEGIGITWSQRDAVTSCTCILHQESH